MKTTIIMISVACLSLLAAFSEAASPSLPKGYASWKKSERKIVTDRTSLFYGIHYMYADGRAWHGYQSDNRFAEGSSIVVEFFNIKDNPVIDGPKNMIVLMRKDKRQKVTGGWYFAGFGADGTPSGLDPVTTCFNCHQKDAATRDFVISTKKDFR